MIVKNVLMDMKKDYVQNVFIMIILNFIDITQNVKNVIWKNRIQK